jgi:(p)ppGpp synthase/HD superfamily hydrolase
MKSKKSKSQLTTSSSSNANLMLSKAIALTAVEFVNKYDRGGNPYSLHCLAVMNGALKHGVDYGIVGVLHDIIEDTSITASQLLQYGFSSTVVDGVVAMSKTPDTSYIDYLINLKKNEIARVVKMYDITHNSDLTRLKGVRPSDIIRTRKYQIAYLYLSNELTEDVMVSMLTTE